METPNNLYEQMIPVARTCLALMLGFSDSETRVSAGFRNRLRDIKPLPDDFTVGDAFNAYIKSISANFDWKQS